MIRLLQVLCGPARHAIYGMMYDDKVISSQEVREGVEALVEMQVDHGIIRRRCEICDAPILQFRYEDNRTIEQDWEKAKAISAKLEAEQIKTQNMVVTARKAAKN
jgi:hypothetical protein